MPLATARALAPAIVIHPADPEADLAMIERLCAACERYTPWAALDPLGAAHGKGAGLWLDITGCDHLFGGEEALLNDIAARFARAGFRTRSALASTPAAAWALARFGATDRLRTLAGAERALLKPLPTAALRLDAGLVEGLDRLGLRRIEDLVHMPRAPLARRFGRIVLDRLDQLFGDVEESLSPRRAPPVHVVRRAFAEPIGRVEDIERTLAVLLPPLAVQLEARGQGVRRLDLVLHRVDNSFATIEVGTSRPVRDPVHLARLFREKLAEIDPGFGIEVAVLAARVTESLSPSQAVFDADRQASQTDPAETARLVDRLANRLGPANVTRLAAEESHLPERACREQPLMSAKPATWSEPPRRPPRPVRLLGQPLPIQVVAQVPDGPPAQFRWRRLSHRVVNAEGPERIAPEWWMTEGRPLAREVRDYYRIEDEEGRRYWVYREGLYLPEKAPGWYLHGFFA